MFFFRINKKRKKTFTLLASNLVVAGADGEAENGLHGRARDRGRRRHALVDDGRVRRAAERLGQRLEDVHAARDLARERRRVEAVALAEREEGRGGGQARDGRGRAGEVARERRDGGVRDGVVGRGLGPPDEACFLGFFCERGRRRRSGEK